MKNVVVKALALTVFATSLVGCAGMSHSQRNTATGAVVGGVAGNVIGGNTSSTLIGAALGGLVGSQWHAR